MQINATNEIAISTLLKLTDWQEASDFMQGQSHQVKTVLER